MSSKSDVFNAMLSPHTKEGQTGVILIHDFPTKVVQLFVYYLRFDKLIHEIDYPFLVDLYKISDKYAVFDLKVSFF